MTAIAPGPLAASPLRWGRGRRERVARLEHPLLAAGLALVALHLLDLALNGLVPRIAPRPVLLIAGGGAPDEIPANRVCHDRGGPTVHRWELPGVGHTAGLRERPTDYERRTTTFLNRALGL